MVFDGEHIRIDDDGDITLVLSCPDGRGGSVEYDSIRLGRYPRVRTRSVSLIGAAEAELERGMEEAERYFSECGDPDYAGMISDYHRASSPAYL